MEKIDKVVLKETYFILYVSVVFSALMQAVILIAFSWNYTHLLGNIFGIFGAVSNFLLMGVTVQKAVLKEPDDAKKLIKLSQGLRLWYMLLIALVGYLVPVFNLFCVVIPFLFPRIAIALRTIKKK